MSSSDEREQNKYQFLEQISTEKLKSMVLSDFLSGDSDDEANDEFITHVLEEIVRREENDPSAPQFDVEAGWERFQSRFFSGEEPASQGRPTQAKADKARSPLPRRIVFRPLRIAAITAVVILLSVMMASALGFGPFNMIAEWTQEIFQFKSEDAPEQGIKVVPESHFHQDQTLETALEERGISTLVLPTWYPEEFELSGTKVYDDLREPMLTALYEDKSTDRTIIVTIVIHEKPKSTVHEKDETPVSIYLKNDIEHRNQAGRTAAAVRAAEIIENIFIDGGVFMKISKEAYLAALLSNIRILVSPESWLRRHKDLLSRYVDIGAVCSLLREADRGILGHASALSGLETAPASSNIRQSLQSVFCRLRVSKDDDTQAQYYPCCPLTLTAPFPGAPCRELPDDVLVPLNRELETAAQNPPKSADDFFTLLDTLLKKHLWCVPAESGPGVDVSLYDKMRSTSAIAVCLEDAGGSQEPFLLLAADFSGIQNYIFAVARTNVKGVAKRLRARSFLVDAMIQSLAYQICEKTEVPYGNILMLTGGKFYILLPNKSSVLSQLNAVRQTLEEDLFQRFYGDISVNLAWVTFGDEGLIDYSATITELSRRLREEKSRAFRSVLTDEAGWREDRFPLVNDLAGKHGCPSCGRRLMDKRLEICPDCRRQEELGGKLAVASQLWFSREGGEFQLWPRCFLSFSRSGARGPLIRVEQLNKWEMWEKRESKTLCRSLAWRASEKTRKKITKNVGNINGKICWSRILKPAGKMRSGLVTLHISRSRIIVSIFA